MSYAWRETIERTSKSAWGTSWGIDAPWAHLAWSQYVLYLYDLQTDIGVAPKLHLPDASHEMLLYAVNPDTPIERDKPLSAQKYALLHPGNYGYQFKAADDAAALARIQAIVDEIVAQRLSPDTDFRSHWNAMFSDAFPLVTSAFTDMAGASAPTH